MRTLRLWIAYDGSRLAGWQRQAGAKTVQELLEHAVFVVSGERVTVHGAGRTDAGVHALAQSAHVRLEGGPPTEVFHKALNSVLPEDVKVLGAREMASHFHARFSSRGKRYLYRIRTGPVPHPVGRQYSHWLAQELDLSAMRRAASHLLGTKDFAAFASNPGHPRKRPTVRTIHSIHLFGSARALDLYVQGDGFLYNMVRNIAGTLVEIGRRKRDPDWVGEALASLDRRVAGPALPARGLFLVRVLYPSEFDGDDPPGGARALLPRLAGLGSHSFRARRYTGSEVLTATRAAGARQGDSELEIEVTVRSGSIPERAKDYAREKISRIHRIFERVGRVHVSLESGKEEAKAHVVAHLDSGATLVADTIHNELQGAIDLLSDKLERQVRKEKERLISRNRRIQTDLETGSPSEEPEPSYEEVIRKDLEEN